MIREFLRIFMENFTTDLEEGGNFIVVPYLVVIICSLMGIGGFIYFLL